MTNILLRSGCPQDFFLYGEDGHRVFDFAQQLREMLRIRGFDQVLALLAIPQCHENGQRVDWYAPSSGPVTPWNNAEQTERDHALHFIAECHSQLQIARQEHRATLDGNGKLFAALLSKILYYPGPQYIYFVNKQPIITFWGFSLDEQDLQIPHHTIGMASENIPDLVPTDNNTMPVEAMDTPSSVAFAECLSKPQTKKRFKHLSIILLGISLMGGILSYGLIQGTSRAKTLATSPKPVALRLAPAPVADTLPRSTLPVEAASFLTDQDIVNEVAADSEAYPMPKMLSLPPHALKRGSTAFLTGCWQVQRIDEPGDPLPMDNLTYHLTDNTGSMVSQTAKQGECRAQVLSGWLPSGRLRIKPSSEVRCRRGTGGTLPTLLCRINAQGETLCKAYTPQQKPIAIRLVQVPAQCE